MIFIRLKHEQRLYDATSVRRRRVGFAFYCVLGLLAAALINVDRSVYAQKANTNQVVFFSIPIGVDVAPVMASPAKDAYQTGAVLKDRYVEVYFRNEEGYCAIRPPQGSFSWLNGKFVEQESEGYGKVVSNSGKAVPSRVGGDSPTTSSVVQVGLHNGQKVRILGKVGLSDGSTWYKISPPPGEFRWIEEKSLVQDEATAYLPEKLMFQSEYVKLLQSRGVLPQENAESTDESQPQTADGSFPELTLPNLDGEAPIDSAEFALNDDSNSSEEKSGSAPAPLQTAQTPKNANIDTSAFKADVARLAAEVQQAVHKNPRSIEEIKILQLRAEALFDAAPSDEDRFQIQSLFNILKKAEKGDVQTLETPRNIQKAPNSTPANTNINTRAVQSPTPNDLSDFYRRGAEAVGAAPQGESASNIPAPDWQSNQPNMANVLPNVTGSLPNLPNAFNGPELPYSANGLPTSPNGLSFGNNGMTVPNGAQIIPNNFGGPIAPNVQTFPGANSGVQWVQATDENGQSVTIPIDANGNVLPLGQSTSGNVVQGMPISTQGTNVGDLPYAYSSANSKNAASNKTNKMAFAFSNGASPFSSKQKGARVISKERQSGTSSNLSKLPSLFPTTQEIVPPQDYNVGVPLSQNRQNSKLVAKAQSKLNKQEPALEQQVKEQLVAETPVQKPARKATGSTLFQQPQIAQKEASDKKDADGPVSLASSNEKKEKSGSTTPNKIRQANNFTPIAVRTKDGYDATGTLIATGESGAGAPRFALLDASGGTLTFTAYLESSKGVVLEQFVGKKVGVKGNVGTIRVGEKTYKLVVVNSVFPQ